MRKFFMYLLSLIVIGLGVCHVFFPSVIEFIAKIMGESVGNLKPRGYAIIFAGIVIMIMVAVDQRSQKK